MANPQPPKRTYAAIYLENDQPKTALHPHACQLSIAAVLLQAPQAMLEWFLRGDRENSMSRSSACVLQPRDT